MSHYYIVSCCQITSDFNGHFVRERLTYILLKFTILGDSNNEFAEIGGKILILCEI